MALPDAEPLTNNVCIYSGFLKYLSTLREIFMRSNLCCGKRPCVSCWSYMDFRRTNRSSGNYILRRPWMLPQVEARLVTCFVWHRLSSSGLKDRFLTQIPTCALWWLTLLFNLAGFGTTKETSPWACLWGFLVALIEVEWSILNVDGNIPWAMVLCYIKIKKESEHEPSIHDYLLPDCGFRNHETSHVLSLPPHLACYDGLYHPELWDSSNSSSSKVGSSSQQWEE